MSSQVRSIQWAMWGNESSLLGAYVLFMGGAIGIVGGILQNFLFWLPIGIYGLVIGFLIGLVEYPRGKKNKGSTMQRCHQGCLSSFVDKLSFAKVYYFRSFFYFVVCLPALLIIPTLLGGVFVMIGCGIYLGAAVRGERWVAITAGPQFEKIQANKVNEPPSRPPPRLPANVSGSSNA